MAKRCWELGEEVSYVTNDAWVEDVRNRIENATKRFEMLTGLHNVLTPVWTFWNAMFLAGRTLVNISVHTALSTLRVYKN